MQTNATVSSTDELIDLVRHCADSHTPIIDYGRAHAALGNPPPEHHLRLDQQSSSIEHDQSDFVIRAAAGATVAQVQDILRPTNQFLPIDADDDLTLAEIIAHNVYGPLRLTYGASRDLLLGLRYVDGHVRDVQPGGRTVKNVAGYDLTRFMVGSLGQFGCIARANLRTYAIPPAVHSVDISLDDPRQLDTALTDWLTIDAAPTHITTTFKNNTATAHLAYHAATTTTNAQRRALESAIASTPTMQIADSDEFDFDQDTTRRAARRAWQRNAHALVKIVVPPAQTGTVCNHLTTWAKQNTPLQIEALPAHGRIFAGADLSAEHARSLDQTINQYLTKTPGFRVWHAQPNDTQPIAPFAPDQLDKEILTCLLHATDPKNLFNPGRYLPPAPIADQTHA